MFAWIHELRDCLAGWQWRRRKGRRSEYRSVRVVPSDQDPTVLMARGHLILIGEAARPKWLRFECPCRCGKVIALNLMPRHRPHWTIEVHEDHRLTARPSVDAKSCGSHFWLRRGVVHWCDARPDEGPVIRRQERAPLSG